MQSSKDHKSSAGYVVSWEARLERAYLQHEDIEKISDGIKAGKLRICNHCNMIIERAGGCKYMMCTNCRYSFCWVCNERWKIGCHKTCSLAMMTTPGNFHLPSFMIAKKN